MRVRPEKKLCGDFEYEDYEEGEDDDDHEDEDNEEGENDDYHEDVDYYPCVLPSVLDLDLRERLKRKVDDDHEDDKNEKARTTTTTTRTKATNKVLTARTATTTTTQIFKKANANPDGITSTGIPEHKNCALN